MYCIQHCFICRPSDSTVSEDAGIEPRTIVTTALAVSRSNHSAKFHPHFSGFKFVNRLSLNTSCLNKKKEGQRPFLCPKRFYFASLRLEKKLRNPAERFSPEALHDVH